MPEPLLFATFAAVFLGLPILVVGYGVVRARRWMEARWRNVAKAQEATPHRQELAAHLTEKTVANDQSAARPEPAKEARGAIYAEAQRKSKLHPKAPLVSFVYHTYDGNFLHGVQREHALQLPLPVAEETLAQLMRYTFRYGLFVEGGAFTPFLAYFNYRAQLRSVRAQADAAKQPRLPRDWSQE
jgi:hypothetical protein